MGILRKQIVSLNTCRVWTDKQNFRTTKKWSLIVRGGEIEFYFGSMGMRFLDSQRWSWGGRYSLFVASLLDTFYSVSSDWCDQAKGKHSDKRLGRPNQRCSAKKDVDRLLPGRGKVTKCKVSGLLIAKNLMCELTQVLWTLESNRMVFYWRRMLVAARVGHATHCYNHILSIKRQEEGSREQATKSERLITCSPPNLITPPDKTGWQTRWVHTQLCTHRPIARPIKY